MIASATAAPTAVLATTPSNPRSAATTTASSAPRRGDAARRVGERRATHLKPHLEDGRERGGDEPIANGTDATSTASRDVRPVYGERLARRGGQRDDGAEHQPDRQRVADELADPRRRRGCLAHHDGDDPASASTPSDCSSASASAKWP